MEYLKKNKSEALFTEAQKYIPGGVNSPVRAFKQVGGTPMFMQSAEGAYLYDVDGNKYIDYINSWGPMILGHRHPAVVEAVVKQTSKAFSFGTPTELEVEMAKLITEMVPGCEMVRMVNSGTEACMSAVRLARGYTGKTKILKFEGHYHGHADMFLKSAGSGVATLNIKSPGGVPASVSSDTIIIPFNDEAQLNEAFRQYADELACVIVEPVAGNMGCVPPLPGFLEHLRKLCTENDIVLIFDEVMTGFRLAKGGAQELFGITADLVTLGKIIGGGLPVGAFGGKKKIMELIAPLGNVYQAGTLSGNPIAMTAGLATLTVLNTTPEIYSELTTKTNFLATSFREMLGKHGVPAVVNQLGSMMSVHFCEAPVTNFADAKRGDNDTFKKFFHGMLSAGIYLPPSAYESWFLSSALSQKDVDYTLNTAEKILKRH